MENIRVTREDDGVAILTLDVPGRPVNVLSRTVVDEFGALFDELESDPAVEAVVLVSGKEDSFAAGADLDELIGFTDASQVADFLDKAHRLLGRIEASIKPVVAAIHGAAYGGGVELVLACRYRIATETPATLLALPEVQLGLIPAAGGTQRLPRLIGLERALRMILSGERVRARSARSLGLIDEVAGEESLLDVARRAARSLADGTMELRRRLPLRARFTLLPLVRNHVLRKASAETNRRTRGLYSAPPAALECVRKGLRNGIQAGLREEVDSFTRLIAKEEARNLIWIFRAMNETRKPSDGVPLGKVKRLGVVGSGFMGEGIASVSLPLCEVLLHDVSRSAVERATAAIHASLRKRLASGSLSEEGARIQAERLGEAHELRSLGGCELVIEAVFEDLALKRRVMEELEGVLDDDAVIASNTSALPIHQIAATMRRPERVLGMHYFSPVPKMPLLEVVRAEMTSDETVDLARAFGGAQGKVPIVVADGPGFYTTRILSPYLNEAITLLDEGAEIGQVESVLKQFGFPVGPLTLLDEVGIDVAAHVSGDLGRAFATRGISPSAAMERLSRAGFEGRKNGRGFFVYEQGAHRRKRLNEEIYSFFGGPDRRSLPHQEIADRLVLLMVNEAVHCLDERVIDSVRDGDLGAVLGLGFPPFRGGPFHYLDAIGAERAVRRLEELATRHGRRFEAAPLLRTMVVEKRTFYP